MDAWVNDIGGAKAGWMLRIAFDFGRMALVALDQHRLAMPPKGIAVAKNSGLPGTMSSGCRT